MEKEVECKQCDAHRDIMQMMMKSAQEKDKAANLLLSIVRPEDLFDLLAELYDYKEKVKRIEYEKQHSKKRN